MAELPKNERYKDLAFYSVLFIILIAVVGPMFLKSDTEQGIADEVERVRNTVVHVSKEGVCQGSGCIISPDGIIFTAKHVTDGKYGEYKITTDDGTEYPVAYAIEDQENDVAFLQLELPEGVKLPYAKLAKRDELRVGDKLFIFGSPLGKDNFNTVSLGILSAKNRNLEERRGWERYEEYDWRVMLQSTSPAFPGNSGGPVFNMDCEVVGVLVAGQAETLNFSVPVIRFSEDLEIIKQRLLLERFKPVREEEETHNEVDWYDPEIEVYPCH